MKIIGIVITMAALILVSGTSFATDEHIKITPHIIDNIAYNMIMKKCENTDWQKSELNNHKVKVNFCACLEVEFGRCITEVFHEKNIEYTDNPMFKPVLAYCIPHENILDACLARATK